MTKIKPMLASDYNKSKNTNFPVNTQPKLDGVRCLAYWENGVARLQSRSGGDYNVSHISDALKNILPRNIIFDGEIYYHGMSFQQISSAVKKPNENTAKLQLWVFDTQHTDSTFLKWKNRRKELDKLSAMTNDVIVFCPTHTAFRASDVRMFHDEYVKLGFEGAIVRDFESKYEGKRSRGLMKLKLFIDDEFMITGHKVGTGAHDGCVIWKCVAKNGKTFDVVPSDTIDSRRAIADIASSKYGQMLKVKYFELTDGGLPRFPIGLGIRYAIDLS